MSQGHESGSKSQGHKSGSMSCINESCSQIKVMNKCHESRLGVNVMNQGYDSEVILGFAYF